MIPRVRPLCVPSCACSLWVQPSQQANSTDANGLPPHPFLNIDTQGLWTAELCGSQLRFLSLRTLLGLCTAVSVLWEATVAGLRMEPFQDSLCAPPLLPGSGAQSQSHTAPKAFHPALTQERLLSVRLGRGNNSPSWRLNLVYNLLLQLPTNKRTAGGEYYFWISRRPVREEEANSFHHPLIYC